MEQVTSVKVTLDGLKVWATDPGDGLYDGLILAIQFDPAGLLAQHVANPPGVTASPDSQDWEVENRRR